MKRLIVPIPKKGIVQVPDQAVIVDEYFDYITETDVETPADAIYASVMDEKGVETVELNKTATTLLTKHTFFGWKIP